MKNSKKIIKTNKNIKDIKHTECIGSTRFVEQCIWGGG
jgi:hypothetical protein